MIILEISDFDGFYGLAQSNNNKNLLQEYIDRFEESFIKRILGEELGSLFIADIQGEDSDSDAISARFQVILDKFIKQEKGRSNMESKGMKAILAGLVYSEYVEDNQLLHSQSGVIVNQTETSDVINPVTAAEFAATKWNSSVVSIHAIQWLCGCKERITYPEYDGNYFRPKYPDFL